MADKKESKGPVRAKAPKGKLGHHCPASLDHDEDGNLVCTGTHGTQLFQSKAEPGMLECPTCHRTYEPV